VSAAGPADAASGAKRPHVLLYTDGACSGNPGPGGWAFILRQPATGKEMERSGAEAQTTNNRMELRAVIEGLTALKRPSLVELYSDSQYVLNGLKEWVESWKKRGWRTADKKPVKNEDLWRALDDLKRTHELRFHWVRGHSEHPENERCDKLAVAAREEIAAGGR
jgi:ribonuclease HI